ncbi:hypothetical protein V498_06625 [Pseudogymnoascus sp. VKM F-4517 (FW-2822)]|nr:hypothetical protein V498_06625 [Pseudogymnoascus sp. VKM F-4517 (FW-2822)]
MLLKRKRSDSEMSSPSYSMSPSPTQSGAIASTPYMSQFGHEITPLHLSSRTRKRVRDNRPSEHQIHENTLNLLFSAQKQHQQQAEPTYPQEPTTPMSAPPQQQSSLHSFWALPARPTSRDSSANSAMLSAPAYGQETNCEDCDTVLVNGDGDAMEMDIDVDMYGGGVCGVEFGGAEEVSYVCGEEEVGWGPGVG